MYLTLSQIQQSLSALEKIHSFFGISFLVAKVAKLPVGDTIEFSYDSAEKDFLENYFKPDPNSSFYYRVFKAGPKRKNWLASDFASSGSQSTRTRGDFAKAFIHTKNSIIWGWKENYLEILTSHPAFTRHGPLPAFHLAVWLYRDSNWQSSITKRQILNKFYEDFGVSKTERSKLFDSSLPDEINTELLQKRQVSWDELKQIIGTPPDATPDEGCALSYLEMRGIGPAKNLQIEPAKRINIITGDNGLGKTFILDCAWWALSGEWAEHPAYPRQEAKQDEPRITFQISGDKVKTDKISVKYNWNTQSWPSPSGRPTVPGLLIYARVDGSFAVWDPAKSSLYSKTNNSDSTGFVVFSKNEVWNGLERSVSGKPRILSNGLLRDWITWQNKPDKYPFETFKQVLKTLSPPESDLGVLTPGEPIRLPHDAREIPTIKHSYGDVPILNTSAGVQRIVALSYLIVWTWEEHKTQSHLIRKSPQKQVVILIDELEAHLHPKWQRVILPALLNLRSDLDPDLDFQYIILTHSPLVLASLEPIYKPELDKLFHLNLLKSSLFDFEVELEEKPFVRYGQVGDWLESDLFELGQARSLESESVIEKAKKLQLQDDPETEQIQDITNKLLKFLPEDDDFWPRWKFFAEKHGVKL
ncbi:MAG: AAA family ATPase [Chloroflexota bacterium]